MNLKNDVVFAYTDRIFYNFELFDEEDDYGTINYTSHPIYCFSDHKPVVFDFFVEVAAIQLEDELEFFTQIRPDFKDAIDNDAVDISDDDRDAIE